MNERIREFAKQAGFKLIRENCYDVVSTMSVQEFAELIVTKCAVIATRGESNGTKNVGAEILDHFGVE